MQAVALADLAEAGELAAFDGEARIGEGRRLGDRLGIAIDSQQLPIGAEPLEDGTGVTAATEGAVEVDPVGIVDQRLHGAIEQHAGMTKAAGGLFRGGWRHALLDGRDMKAVRDGGVRRGVGR